MISYSPVKIRCVWRRNTNLKEQLCPAILPVDPLNTFAASSSSLQPGHYKCGHCNVCDITMEITEFTHRGTTYIFQHRTTCGSMNVVYVISCPCGLLYVGKTIRTFRTRIREHSSRLKCKTLEAPLVQHCLNQGHIFEQLRCFVIDHVHIAMRGRTIDETLLWKEQKWIFTLNTAYPSGLNIRLDLTLCL